MKKKEAVVRKSNVFIDGRYRFGLHEQKILLLIVSQIRTDQKEFIPYRVSWSEIKRISKGKLNTVAKIDKACESLKNKTISVKDGRVTDNFGFLSGWKTYQGKYIDFRIDPGMKSMLLNLLEEGNFTLYDLEFALALPSPHAIRMYEILKSLVWKSQPVEIDLDKLKHALDISPKSRTYSDFGSVRRFILDRSQKNLEKYTDIVFDYEPIKEGRKVASIRFWIKDNVKYQKTVQAKSKRDFIRPGDLILIAGEECEVVSGGCYYKEQAIPIGRLNEMYQNKEIEKVKK